MADYIKETCLKHSLCKYKNIIFSKLIKLLCNDTNINDEKQIYKALVYYIISYIYLMNFQCRYVTWLIYNEHEDFIDQFIKEYLKLTSKEDYLTCNFSEDVSMSLSIFYDLYNNY